jgi:hypothetical protein
MITAKLGENQGARWLTISGKHHLSCSVLGNAGGELTVFSGDGSYETFRPIFDALLPIARREGWLDAERPELISEEEAQALEADDAR